MVESTMTSRDIARLTGTRHADVLRKIRRTKFRKKHWREFYFCSNPNSSILFSVTSLLIE